MTTNELLFFLCIFTAKSKHLILVSSETNLECNYLLYLSFMIFKIIF